jgi:excisionase family DNA binding protein
MQTLIEKPFLTVGETQAFLGSSRSFVYKLVKKRKLNAHHVGKRVYYRMEQVLTLFEPDEVQPL